VFFGKFLAQVQHNSSRNCYAIFTRCGKEYDRDKSDKNEHGKNKNEGEEKREQEKEKMRLKKERILKKNEKQRRVRERSRKRKKVWREDEKLMDERKLSRPKNHNGYDYPHKNKWKERKKWSRHHNFFMKNYEKTKKRIRNKSVN